MPTQHKTGLVSLYSHAPVNDSWNNLSAIRFTVVMFNSQCLPVYAVSLLTRNLRQTEALRTMPSPTTHNETFEQLALPLFASLYNNAFWLTRNQAEAEDLVQETFSKALRAFDSFQPGTNFKAWIFRILRNTFLTTRTGIAASRTVFLEDHPDTLDTAAGVTPEDTLIRLDNQAALHTALEQLHPPLREVLLLCEVEEIKYKDIAVILDVPIGTVMSRISRARRTLRQLLQPQFGKSL
ncbi:MAG TPA: RNA polymerase sigma factor [Edaphobacter sp.]|nr:RNA polymerase sigma factor [Edaphobacter sp.]